MTGAVLRMRPPDAAAFAPYGRFMTPPAVPGTRAFYSDAFTDHPADTAAALHVNNVIHQVLPFAVRQIERHPHAAQCFLPLDVARYAVVVMPSDPQGEPLPEQALAFDLPGTVGVIYHPRVWHMGATVLERNGHFAVLMWRGGEQADDDFRDIPPITLTETD